MGARVRIKMKRTMRMKIRAEGELTEPAYGEVKDERNSLIGLCFRSSSSKVVCELDCEIAR